MFDWMYQLRTLRYEINDHVMKLLKNDISILELIYMY